MKSLFSTFFVLICLMAPTTTVFSADWPQWRGTHRDGISPETGLIDSVAESGPEVAWTVGGIGEGYGSASIANGQVYVQGTDGGRSVVFCLSEADGKLLWTTALGKSLDQNKGGGPRSTPTVEDDSVWAMSEAGDLARLNPADGKVLWHRGVVEELQGRQIGWHLSESPLVYGDTLVVFPGARSGSAVGLHKLSGREVWRSKGLKDKAGYASAIYVEVEGIPLVMNFTSDAGVGISATDGELMWEYKAPANGTANCTTPVYQDGKVFFSSGYGTGGGMLDLKREGAEVRSEEVYFTKDMQNHHGGMVLVDGYLYGFSGQALTCIRFSDGERIWRDRSVGKGSLMAADGKLFLVGEGRTLGIAKASPDGYEELGRFRVEDKGWPVWAHPSLANGNLYIRNWDQLTAYKVKK